MADEYIKRSDALQFVFDACSECMDACEEFDGIYPDCHQCMLESVKLKMRDISPADVVPVRHGRWEHRWICSNMTGYEYACSCSECDKPTYRISTLEPMPLYCHNCGAKMDAEVNE